MNEGPGHDLAICRWLAASQTQHCSGGRQAQEAYLVGTLAGKTQTTVHSLSTMILTSPSHLLWLPKHS